MFIVIGRVLGSWVVGEYLYLVFVRVKVGYVGFFREFYVFGVII